MQNYPYPPRQDSPAGPASYPGNPPSVGVYPPPHYYPPSGPVLLPVKPFSTNSIISMVLGGVGILMMPLGVITGPIGILLGWIGMKEAREPEGTRRGRGLAIGGLITSLIALLLSVLLVIGYIFFFSYIFKVVETTQERAVALEIITRAEDDMRRIEERLREYFIDNRRSLGPGGPILSTFVEEHLPESEDEDTDAQIGVVHGELLLEHLISNFDLSNSIEDYELNINDTTKARLYCRSVDRVMHIDYSVSRETSIRRISDEP